MFTFAAMALQPISVWIWNAKSRAVAPFMMVFCSPRGVKTTIVELVRSLWMMS